MAKMKDYVITIRRHNPQLKNGGYETKRTVQAASIASARRQARKIVESCIYGSIEVLSIELAKQDD